MSTPATKGSPGHALGLMYKIESTHSPSSPISEQLLEQLASAAYVCRESSKRLDDEIATILSMKGQAARTESGSPSHASSESLSPSRPSRSHWVLSLLEL